MLERHPILKDRLQACGVFTGIAIAAVSGLEMVIGGGFDIVTPGREIREVAPSSYVEVDRSPWFTDARVTPLSSTEPLFIGDYGQADERLAGRYDDASAPDGQTVDSSDEHLRREIDALYRAYNPVGRTRAADGAPTPEQTSEHAAQQQQATVASYAPDDTEELPAIGEPDARLIEDEPAASELTADTLPEAAPAAQNDADIAAAKDKGELSASETASPW